MDFANRGNKPQQQHTAPQQKEAVNMSAAPQVSTAPVKQGKGGFDMGKAGKVFLLFGATILLVALIVALIFGGDSDSSGKKEADMIMSDKYQAIFLNSQDGQVYFGKLDVFNDDMYLLTDIYYVRVTNPVQPEGPNQPPQQANISLAKLGNELHAPEDEMYIRRDQVLYWENLKDDGQVVSAINEYVQNGGAEAQQQQQQTTPAGTPADTPTDTPAGTPTETPTETPAETPTETPAAP